MTIKARTKSGTALKINKSVEGETIEQKMERIVNNKEPIKDGAPLLYTERKEGVRASTNIRTDRFDVALEAADKIARSYMARREGKAKPEEPTTTDDKGRDNEGNNGGNEGGKSA